MVGGPCRFSGRVCQSGRGWSGLEWTRLSPRASCRNAVYPNDPARPPRLRLLFMCGGHADEPLISFRAGDVVEFQAGHGSPSEIGRVEEIDPAWGVAVIWTDGLR